MVTNQFSERGSARKRLIHVACDMIRAKGFAATSVSELCEAAAATRGAFLHHFEGKEALGVASVRDWTERTAAFFVGARYHDLEDALDRVLAYSAFRKSIIIGDAAAFTCLAGTMVQELYASSPPIRDACGDSIFGHATMLEADIGAAIKDRSISADWTAESLARHMQTVLRGAFVLAKAANDPAPPRESSDQLERYVRLLFRCPNIEEATP